MADQTILNNGDAAAAARSRTNGSGLMGNVSSFGNDLATLATLQSKLAAADARASLAKAAPAIAGIALATLLAFAGVVVLLGGLSLWIALTFQWQTWAALLLTGGGALVLAALIGVVCIRLFGSSFTTFRRSSEEFERNLAWVKTTLTHSGR